MKLYFQELIKSEIPRLIGVFVIILLAFLIAFHKSSLTQIVKITSAFLFLFFLPGYSIMLYWRKSLSFTIRTITGIAVGSGVVGIMSYYLGVIGMNVNSHHVFVPIILIVAGIVLGSQSKD